MVSDVELAEKLQELLSNSDLKNTTNNIVLHKLESEFGVNLSHKKPFLRNQVDRFLQSQYFFSEELQLLQHQHQQQLSDAAALLNGGGNDVVSDSDDDHDDDDDDEYFEDDADFAASVHAQDTTNHHHHHHHHGINSFDSVAKFQRSHKQSKARKKRVCESGKFCTLSPELQQFLGAPHMTRAEVVRHLWSYVRDKNLQDPQDGKTIICDEILRGLFGVDSINILQINKALTKHIWPSVKSTRREKPQKQEMGEVKLLKKDKPRKQEREEDPLEAEMKEKRSKRVYSGFLAPLPLSDTLIRFLGTGESALTRADVIKRVWEYIKDKNLQDPYEKKTVICDEKLKELFHVDSFHGFTVSKLLSAHFVKL